MNLKSIAEIDQKRGELEAKRRECIAQAEQLDAKAADEEPGNSESAERAFRLRAQIPAIERSIHALQGERVEAVEQERAARNVEKWRAFAKEADSFMALARDHDAFIAICAVQRHALLNRAEKFTGFAHSAGRIMTSQPSESILRAPRTTR